MATFLRIERAAFWICVLVAAFVHWIPTFPPQIDLAQHAAQIRLLHDLARSTFPYRADFELNYFTPYLPAYLTGALLALVVPVVAATKLVWSFGALGSVAATVYVRRQFARNAAWDWLLVPGLFGTTFVWGLLTFQFAIPLGVLAFYAWICLLKEPTRARCSMAALMFVGLFFCHALVMAWTLASCGLAMLISRSWQRGWRTFLAISAPLFAPIPVAFAWYLGTRNLAQAASHTDWSFVAERYQAFFASWTSVSINPLGTVMGALLILSPFTAGGRVDVRSPRVAALLITAIAVLIAPSYVMGNAFTYHRFFAFLGPSLVIALAGAPPGRDTLRVPMTRPLWWWLPVLSIVITGGMVRNVVLLDREQESFVELLHHMEPDKRVLSLVHEKYSRVLPGEPWYLHVPVWYQARHGGVVEFSFASLYPTIVRFRDIGTHQIDERFAANPRFDTPSAKAQEFDYYVIRDSMNSQGAAVPLHLQLVYRSGDWALYERAGSFSR